MDAQPEATTPSKQKKSVNWRGLVVWGLVGLPLLYVFSTGPYMLMKQRGIIEPGNEFIVSFYGPFYWVYSSTPLRKPLAIYIHWWVPEYYDKNGDPVHPK